MIKDYADLPKVECFPGQLNQVFINILANAIDALDDCSENNCSENDCSENDCSENDCSENDCSEDSLTESLKNSRIITITTAFSVDQTHAVIQIRDNAMGMPEEIRSRIFSHLFTTKEVGKGTGLGLSIARQIIEKTHGGHLTCNSMLGKGTEFVVEIPITIRKLP